MIQNFATVVTWCHTSPLYYQSVVVENLCDYVCRVHPRRRVPQGDTRWDDKKKGLLQLWPKKTLNMQAWILQIIYQDFLAYLGKNLYCVPFIFIANNIQICVIFIVAGKINVKFHKNCDYTGKSLKISCVRCNFVKFDIYFLGLH